MKSLGWALIQRDCCPPKKRRDTKAHRGKTAAWTQTQRLERSCHKPRDTWGDWKLQEGREEPPLEVLEGASPCQHLDLGLGASQTRERLSFHCCKPASLWPSVTAVLWTRCRPSAQEWNVLAFARAAEHNRAAEPVSWSLSCLPHLLRV